MSRKSKEDYIQVLSRIHQRLENPLVEWFMLDFEAEMSSEYVLLKFFVTGNKNKLLFEVVPAKEKDVVLNRRRKFSKLHYIEQTNVSKPLVFKPGYEPSIDIEVDKVLIETLKYDASTKMYEQSQWLSPDHGKNIVIKMDGKIIYEDTLTEVHEKQFSIYESLIIPDKVLESPEVFPMSPRTNLANGEGFAQNYGSDDGPTPMSPRPSFVSPIPTAPPFEPEHVPALGQNPVAAPYHLSNVHLRMPVPESYQDPVHPAPPANQAPPIGFADYYPRYPGHHFLPPQNVIHEYMYYM